MRVRPFKCSSVEVLPRARGAFLFCSRFAVRSAGLNICNVDVASPTGRRLQATVARFGSRALSTAQ